MMTNLKHMPKSQDQLKRLVGKEAVKYSSK